MNKAVGNEADDDDFGEAFSKVAIKGEKPVSETWPCEADGYELGAQIGQGAFAEVHFATCKTNGQEVAIKIMELEKIVSNFEEIRKEVATMRMMSHKNVLTLLCSFVHKSQLWLVMNLMSKGSCLHIIQTLKRKGLGDGLREEWTATILKEMLEGLVYFHENGQIHRDVKAGNVLIGGKGEILLADFGVSGWLMERGEMNKKQTFVGTPCWMAPEVMEQVEGYDYKADIWSFGITALELAKGHAPYAKYQPMKVLLMTLQHPPPSLGTCYDDDRDSTGKRFSQNFKDMVAACLQKKPSKRPTAQQLLKMAFFKKAPHMSVLKDELCSLIPDLTVNRDQGMAAPAGVESSAPSDAADQSTLGYGEGAGAGAGAAPASAIAESSQYARGTTWVFDSDEFDSGVPVNAKKPPALPADGDDDDKVFDAAAFETGETYVRPSS